MQEKGQRRPFAPHLGFDLRDRDPTGIPGLRKNRYRKGARFEGAEVMRIDPEFSLKHFSKTIPFKNQTDTHHLINALRKAGLPD